MQKSAPRKRFLVISVPVPILVIPLMILLELEKIYLEKRNENQLFNFNSKFKTILAKGMFT